MGPLDLLFHLLNFVAPALGVSVLLTTASGYLGRPAARPGGFWRRCIVNAVVGSVVLFAALVLFGRDGKMMAYLALVLATASSEWWQSGTSRKGRAG